MLSWEHFNRSYPGPLILDFASREPDSRHQSLFSHHWAWLLGSPPSWSTDLISTNAFLMLNTSDHAQGNHKFWSGFERGLSEILRGVSWNHKAYLACRLKVALFFFPWSFPHYSICPVLLNQLVYLVEQRLHTDSNYRVCPSFKLVCEVLVIRTPNKQVEG